MLLRASVAVLLFPLAISAAEPRLQIVTSFLPLYCWTANVAGEVAAVDNLLPSRSEPHEYAFTPGDARKLSRADLIVVNGLGLESWLPGFLRGFPAMRDRIVTVSSGFTSNLIAVADHSRPSAPINPHVWLDPLLAANAVSNISLELQRMDAAHAAACERNALAYIVKLQRLDADLRQSLAGLTNRALVTYHDAFPYFARRYGLEIAGVVEQVADVNPTPKYLSQLRRTMRERGIHTIFIAPGSTTPLARRIARDLEAELVELDTLESGPLSPSAYEERMRRNAAVLQQHLK